MSENLVIDKISVTNAVTGESTVGDIGAKAPNIETPVRDGKIDVENPEEWIPLTDYLKNTNEIPTNHASADDTYGKGTSQLFGHVKLTDVYNTTSASDANSGVAVSQKALSDAYNQISSVIVPETVMRTTDFVDPEVGAIKQSVGGTGTSDGSLNGVMLGTQTDGGVTKYGYWDGSTFKSFRQPTGNATAGDVLSGKTFANADSDAVNGQMYDNGAVSQALNCGGSYIVPAGYHNGSGKVTANSLASQTSANATAGQILKNQTAWVNGSKVTGTMNNYSGNSRQTVTPSAGTGNQQLSLLGGYHDSVIVNRTNVYNSGITQGQADKSNKSITVTITPYWNPGISTPSSFVLSVIGSDNTTIYTSERVVFDYITKTLTYSVPGKSAYSSGFTKT